ncbi:hypothetical protein EHI46_26190 [Rhizobium leguminosarum]|uniref:hypothetical protein n=1 Tax=Rhizobium leguminosarum TaxID=384 RepID=UPI000FF406D1|nr:hypothetical protein [Rhizobium leguminosarum]RWY67860.1 hypothetical protein EHI46_26190 [Rhizobium leguminosarum]
MSYLLILEDKINTSFSETGGGRRKSNALTGEKSARNDDLLRQLNNAAIQIGGSVTTDRRSKIESISTRDTGPKYQPVEIRDVVEIVTYVFGSATALAIFLRNVVGIVVDYQKLKDQRSTIVKLGDEEFAVKPGEDILKKVIERYPAIKDAIEHPDKRE